MSLDHGGKVRTNRVEIDLLLDRIAAAGDVHCLDEGQRVALKYVITRRNAHRAHHAADRRGDHMFHFHGFHDEHRLAFAYRLCPR